MAGRSLIAQVLRCLLLSGTAGCFTSTPASSALAESVARLTEQPELRDPLPEIAAESGLGAVFATRWSEPPRDFALGADGKFRHAILPNVKEEINGRGVPRVDLAEPQKETQFRSNSDLPAGPFADKCGQSPADPDEIKTLVAEAAERYRVDPTFALAIAFVESRFDRHRNSSKGARGPMQLIPATAVRFGVGDICNPASNIEGGVAYLRQLFDEFRNPLLVAAAYNAGENRIREHGGIPPIRETLGFVADVINYQLGASPAAGRRAASDRSFAKPFNVDMPTKANVASSPRRQWVDGVMQF